MALLLFKTPRRGRTIFLSCFVPSLLTLLLLFLSLLLLITTTPAAAAAANPSDHPYNNISSRILMSDGHSIPLVGLGLALTADSSYDAVQYALSNGYRLLDTAAEESYGNEQEVGRAIRDYYQNNNNNTASRDDIFVTTKLWDDSHGFWETLEAFEESYEALNVGTIDLYLIHSPFGGSLVETWDALLYLQSKSYVQSIGVSNFGINHLQVIKDNNRPMPMVNQIEMHPLVYRQRQELIQYCRTNNILIQAYGSLIMLGYREWVNHEVLVNMAARYSKSTSQVLLRWALQHDFLIIPKSAKNERIVENSLLFDFELSQEDMGVLDSLGDNRHASERNLYKQDWNWNPIDEAPVHIGRTDYWPKYQGVDEIYYSDDKGEEGNGDEL